MIRQSYWKDPRVGIVAFHERISLLVTLTLNSMRRLNAAGVEYVHELIRNRASLTFSFHHAQIIRRKSWLLWIRGMRHCEEVGTTSLHFKQTSVQSKLYVFESVLFPGLPIESHSPVEMMRNRSFLEILRRYRPSSLLGLRECSPTVRAHQSRRFTREVLQTRSIIA